MLNELQKAKFPDKSNANTTPESKRALPTIK